MIPNKDKAKGNNSSTVSRISISFMTERDVGDTEKVLEDRPLFGLAQMTPEAQTTSP